jgi:catechol 2,3-dioxygenase-like lactoylglutathione lyase family enzyme
MNPGRRLDAQITHVGIFVRDMDRMLEYYIRMLGLMLTDRGPYYRGGEIAFLSRKADEHHQVVFASGRPPGEKSTINQISFLVADLEALRSYYAAFAAEGVPGLEPINHGNAWSLYWPDLEGNRLEVYTYTPWHVQQPFADKLDLSEPVELIITKTYDMIKADPSHCPRDAWIDRQRARLAQ